MYHIPPPLREYQCRAVGDVLSTSEPTCLVAPTGSGKSRMGAEIAASLPGRGAWIVHRRELLRQARDLLARHGLDDRVVPATVQSSEWPVADFVVIDETHHMVSDEWSQVFAHYSGARTIGLTATPERADGRALGDRFSRLVVAAHYSDLLRDGFLVDCRVLRPDEVLNKGLALDPVDAYLKHGEQRAGFVFVQRVSQAREIAERFRAAGIEARAVTERCSTAERDAAIDGLASGQVRLLVNVYTLTEGVDIPHASVCILARPVGHVSQYLQIAGRILRPCDGKQDALLIDLTGASHLHGLPTEDRLYSLDGVGIRRKSQSVTTCQLCGASYESGPAACPACGFVLPHKDWKPPRVMNVELRAVYRGAATPDDAKRREYERLRLEQILTLASVESVVVRYRRLFGDSPLLSDVSTMERRMEFYRFQNQGGTRGYKAGYAHARYTALFGGRPPERILKEDFLFGPDYSLLVRIFTNVQKRALEVIGQAVGSKINVSFPLSRVREIGARYVVYQIATRPHDWVTPGAVDRSHQTLRAAAPSATRDFMVRVRAVDLLAFDDHPHGIKHPTTESRTALFLHGTFKTLEDLGIDDPTLRAHMPTIRSRESVAA